MSQKIQQTIYNFIQHCSSPMHPHPETSLSNHYLQSILPFQTGQPLKQILKSKQFYKPQQFIWNNPHRTSKRLYPYYHQFNDNYIRNIQPKVDRLQEQDRNDQEQSRIQRLREGREDTRRKFHSRKQMRHMLEAQVGSRKLSTQPTVSMTQSYKHQKATKSFSNALIKPPNTPNSKLHVNQSAFNFPNKLNTGQGNSFQLSTTQICYNKSIREYDEQVERRKQIFTQQMQYNHEKIREQFNTRRKLNELLNSRIKSKRASFREHQKEDYSLQQGYEQGE